MVIFKIGGGVQIVNETLLTSSLKRNNNLNIRDAKTSC